MPRDDPALPPGVNGVKREIAKRVWWQLVFSGTNISEKQIVVLASLKSLTLYNNRLYAITCLWSFQLCYTCT